MNFNDVKIGKEYEFKSNYPFKNAIVIAKENITSKIIVWVYDRDSYTNRVLEVKIITADKLKELYQPSNEPNRTDLLNVIGSGFMHIMDIDALNYVKTKTVMSGKPIKDYTEADLPFDVTSMGSSLGVQDYDINRPGTELVLIDGIPYVKYPHVNFDNKRIPLDIIEDTVENSTDPRIVNLT